MPLETIKHSLFWERRPNRHNSRGLEGGCIWNAIHSRWSDWRSWLPSSSIRVSHSPATSWSAP